MIEPRRKRPFPVPPGAEVFGHLSFALADASPMVDYFLADTAPLLGQDFPSR